MSSLFIIIIGPDTHSEFTGDTEYNLVSLFFFYLKYIYTKADIYIYYIHINFYNIYKHAHTHTGVYFWTLHFVPNFSVNPIILSQYHTVRF